MFKKLRNSKIGFYNDMSKMMIFIIILIYITAVTKGVDFKSENENNDIEIECKELQGKTGGTETELEEEGKSEEMVKQDENDENAEEEETIKEQRVKKQATAENKTATAENKNATAENKNATGDKSMKKIDCVAWWRYKGERGQDHWCCKGSHLCCGDFQSPINIEIRSAKYDIKAKCLTMLNYECLPKSMALYNNGHTVELRYNWCPKEIPHVMDGPICGQTRFNLDRAVFHWGVNSSQGSEHMLDYVAMPLEMQLVHINSKYKDIKEALSKKDGILIISVLFMLTYEENDQLRDLIYPLHHVTYLGQTKCIKPFPFLKLLPPTYGYYYSYRGSLTMPPCSENVQWIVFHNPVYISDYQINEFRKLQDMPEILCPKRDCPMVDNFRRTMCVKTRTIYWKEECSPKPKCK